MNRPSARFPESLVCHSQARTQAISGVEVLVEWQRDGLLALVYILRGNLSRLRIPEPRPPRQADRLWEHTCLEAFVGAKQSEAYYEFNFSPSGEWGSYEFRHYRDGGPIGDGRFDPAIALRQLGDCLELDAVIHITRMPNIGQGAHLVLGLAAVIEELGGRFTYWALKHPPGNPDFHHRANFALELSPPGDRP